MVTGDIEKMYRKILINPSQISYQQILWRESPSDELCTYQLHTVTYGTVSAPYLTVRCLRYLADEYFQRYPRESQIIKHDIYVDDLLTGADSVKKLHILYKNIYQIFKHAGFILKWNSNTLDIEGGDIKLENSGLQINSNSDHKTLGIKYDPLSETRLFSYRHCSNVTQHYKETHFKKCY